MELYNSFYQALKTENKDLCVYIVLEALSTGKTDIVTLYEEILTPALNTMECFLDDQKWCIWLEHIRSGIIRTIVECCYPHVVKFRKKKIGKRAVVICPDGEYHEIGARIVNDFFTMLGFESYFIGASTPKEEFLSVITKLKPDYIAISVTNYYNLVSAKKTISMIKESLSTPVKIVVGGNAFIENKDVFTSIGADYLANSYKDLEQIVKEGKV